MNKKRRKQIQHVKDSLLDLMSHLEEIKNEEQAAYNNLPESFQNADNGEIMSLAIENLDSAYSSLEEIGGYLDEAMQ